MQDAYGLNHKRFKHHVLVLPKNMKDWMGPGCSWAGNAVVGFAEAAWSYAWINGNNWDKIQVGCRLRSLWCV